MLNAFPDSTFDCSQKWKSEMISKRVVEAVDTFMHCATQLIRLSNGFYLAKSSHRSYLLLYNIFFEIVFNRNNWVLIGHILPTPFYLEPILNYLIQSNEEKKVNNGKKYFFLIIVFLAIYDEKCDDEQCWAKISKRNRITERCNNILHGFAFDILSKPRWWSSDWTTIIFKSLIQWTENAFLNKCV